MKTTEAKLKGIRVIDFEKHADERGSYTRVWGLQEFRNLGMEPSIDNIGISRNNLKGTFRGMHFQAKPFEEAKVVQCIRGRILDIVLDIREGSETFGEHESFELSGGESRAVYIPKGFAHGFQTLEDNSEMLYFISTPFDPASSRGIRWNDSRFSIELPLEITSINERDATYPDFS
ncbi:MAG: dTDP-4-dehydrorhamnose 3,5-epimerase family protein [Pyrinomonadaceae bacterium]|nr:dTDP-4-dehydrorhamnose 3,5-epimerase family protein [Pyrinomonadaceae bacterium]